MKDEDREAHRDDDRHAEEVERWLADDLGAERRRELERRALEDPRLAEEAYAGLELRDTMRTAAADSLRRSTAPRPARGRRVWYWGGGAVAAVIALVILFLPREIPPGSEPEPRLRGDGEGPVPLMPQGEWRTFPRRFGWRSAASGPGVSPDVDYRWELYDDQARRRAMVVVGDSLLVRPASATPADSVGTWRWLVTELAPDGSEGATGAAATFEVLPPTDGPD